MGEWTSNKCSLADTKDYGKIAVFAGGFSSEREISLKSGRAVYEALRKKTKLVEFFDIGADFHEGLASFEYDIVFLALHGEFGEDGTIQAILEEHGILYTGSGVQASRLAMDKISSREAFLANGLRVPRYKTVEKDSSNSYKESVVKDFDTPFVVKPRYSGSSIGLSVVTEKEKFHSALEKAFSYGDSVIVEEYICGREFTVGILEERPLPVIEITTKCNVYDFDAKYLDGETKYILPAPLEVEQYIRTQASALRAHQALGCRDFSRVDMRMDRFNNVYILEVNTIPGMTERSLLPKAASSVGISFEDLCIMFVDLAYRRKGKGDKHAKK